MLKDPFHWTVLVLVSANEPLVTLYALLVILTDTDDLSELPVPRLVVKAVPVGVVIPLSPSLGVHVY